MCTDLDFGPFVPEPFAPYCEVRFYVSRVLPYCTTFGIPYHESKVRHRLWYIKGDVVLTDPFDEPFEF